ncbi:hypothetical protein PCNPT3_02130 [Psychromonas sp. CNPT3]|uniref:peptidoglycan editing factor PgeF n=1 Tax=Psychromonas sp. CNPT3 TaxID=314282 RepID=UPI00006EA016|nr:peptidoglycan editing factor PgeF [Psychromonas sp. CNPT3]AGH80368.1 hypothetical protein PCNPT3_02130 [Psychromonas sp. CNPT3]
MLKLIEPNWSAPKHIKCYSTTRLGGVSSGVYQGLNLGSHVSDHISLVLKNRQNLQAHLQLDAPFCWLKQTHSTILLNLTAGNAQEAETEADAVWTQLQQQVCVVMTADCLPIMITDKQGSFVCAIHAGWRGLCDAIIEKTIAHICLQLCIQSRDLLVWLGPCIGPSTFEVGSDVRNAFMRHDQQSAVAFTAQGDKYLADLHALARLRIQEFNVAEITNSDHCTYSDPSLFYSYRRDGVCGRMATLIYIDEA